MQNFPPGGRPESPPEFPPEFFPGLFYVLFCNQKKFRGKFREKFRGEFRPTPGRKILHGVAPRQTKNPAMVSPLASRKKSAGKNSQETNKNRKNILRGGSGVEL